MSDNIRESLSALMDGEASEIELHRLLRQVEEDSGLKNSWFTYQQIRSVIGRDQRISRQAHLELNHRIHAAIEAESPFADETGRKPRPATVKLLKPVGGLAVAASLVAAIFMGVQTTQLVDSETPIQDSNDVAAQTAGKSPLAPLAVAGPSPQTPLPSLDSEPFGDESELRELDEEKKKLLRAYLNRHDRLSKMNPYARFTTNKNK